MQVLGLWAALATVAISALGLGAYALAFNIAKKKALA